MTNKPMLSVDRELLSTALKADASIGATATELVKGWVAMVELRALLDKPVVESEFEPDAVCTESDGCPTEGAVLKRFWRENQPDPVLCEFYEAEDFPSLVRELVGHVAQLQEAAKRNVKPWEDTFPPTLLPAYIARINAEQPSPVAVVMPDVDELAQIIRKVDGSHTLGAGSLAEAILEEVARLNGVTP